MRSSDDIASQGWRRHPVASMRTKAKKTVSRLRLSRSTSDVLTADTVSLTQPKMTVKQKVKAFKGKIMPACFAPVVQ